MPDIRNGNTDEPDRRTVIANDIVVDVIANEDGSVYVEFYPYYGVEKLDFSDVVLDRFYGGLGNAHPSLRVMAK